MKDQLTTNNGRMKPTQPPIVPQDYYGTITNRHSPGTETVLSILYEIEHFP